MFQAIIQHNGINICPRPYRKKILIYFCGVGSKWGWIFTWSSTASALCDLQKRQAFQERF